MTSHLQASSPCIDAGDPSGVSDPDGSVADLGAFPSLHDFLRGDADADGDVDAIADALFLLRWGFTGRPSPSCLDAADVDDNGKPSPLLDAFALLRWSFADDPPPSDPGPIECGPDPTQEDSLSCGGPSPGC